MHEMTHAKRNLKGRGFSEIKGYWDRDFEKSAFKAGDYFKTISKKTKSQLKDIWNKANQNSKKR